MYEFLSKFPITRRYVYNTTRIIETIKATDSKSAAMEAMLLMLRNFLITSLLLIVGVIFLADTLYHYISVFILMVLYQHQMLLVKLEREEYKLLSQFEKFLDDVRHYYHTGCMVEEALLDSLEDTSSEISRHMERIYDILCEDSEEELEQYHKIAPNKFFTTFLSLCKMTMVYGDSMQSGTSLYLTNINYLKKEIHIELLKREKMKHVFSGLILLICLPIFFLKSIEDWSISNLPELIYYYHGSYGILVTISIFLATTLSYYFVNYLKGTIKIMPKEHYILEKLSNLKPVNHLIQSYIFHRPSRIRYLDRLLSKIGEGITVRQFLVQKCCLFIIAFFAALVVFLNIITISKSNVIKSVQDVAIISFSHDKAKEESYRHIITSLILENKNQNKGSITKQHINQQLIDQYEIYHEFDRNVMTEEVWNRIIKYHSYYFSYLHVMIAFLFGVGVSHLPLILLESKKYFLRKSMEDEVIQLHSVILMLIHMKRMSVLVILEWMEFFSEIFKNSLTECIDNFSLDEEEALQKLKEAEPFLPFVRIVENLEASDRIGIECAFDEIENQRNYFAEKRKQDNEIQISNRGVIAKIIAYIPLTLTLALYLIIPFVLESISQLMGYIHQLQTI